MNSKTTRLLSVLISVAGVQACAQNNGKVDLGANLTGASLADYVDQWDGYTEALQFVPGSDRVRVKINGDGQGTLMLGESHTYPVPTDPNLGYPPDDDAMAASSKPMFEPGFEYTLHGVKVESKRIRFTVSTNDFYKAWCELQTPVETHSPGQYLCGPDSFSGNADGMCFTGDTATPVNCAKAILCGAGLVCSCTATSCTANEDFYIQFDAALGEEGAQLVGTFNNATVRLDRQ